MEEQAILSSDKLNEIRLWLEYQEEELSQERISLDDVIAIDLVHDLIKEKPIG